MKRKLFFLLFVLAVTAARADSDVQISTLEELVALRENVNDGGNTYSGQTVRLMNDIDVGSWTPIGTTVDEAKNFFGTFDGQGYTLNIEVSVTDNEVAGLFGYLRGTVQNLKVTGSVTNSYTVGTNYAGGIAAYNAGTISQCANMANVVGVTAGGIAGENHGTITNCYNRGYIGACGEDANFFLAGIAGKNDDGTITHVYSSNEVDQVSSSGAIYANPTEDVSTLENNHCYYNVKYKDTSDYIHRQHDLTGTALNGKLNTEGDYTVWTFTDGQLPELTCFKTVLLSNAGDNSTIIANKNGQTAHVRLADRTLYKDNSWNTLCLPFSLTAEALSTSPLADATIMTLSTASFASATGTLTLNFTNASTIEAGKPYLVKWASGDDISNPQFSDVTISNTHSDIAISGVVTFKGTYSAISYDADNTSVLFLGISNNLYYPQSGAFIGTQRAYFQLADGIHAGNPAQGVGVRAFQLNFGSDDGVTEIEKVESRESRVERFYDLQGRQFTGKPTGKGIYIYRNRKVVIR